MLSPLHRFVVPASAPARSRSAPGSFGATRRPTSRRLTSLWERRCSSLGRFAVSHLSATCTTKCRQPRLAECRRFRGRFPCHEKRTRFRQILIPPLPAAERRRLLVPISAELVKARLTLLVLLTTAVGYYLGAVGPINPLGLFHAVFGTALAAAGAAALNQWWERRLDALMHRTRSRPIPAGRMLPREALDSRLPAFVRRGRLPDASLCNWLSATLAAATIVIYIFAYTPLKRDQHLQHAGRSDPRRSAAGRRLGRRERTRRDRRLEPCSPFSFSGNCPTFSRSPGCIAKITRGPDSR